MKQILKKGHKLALICRPANCYNNGPIKNEVKVDLILSNDYGDGNENGKKAIGVDQQNNYSARASRFFVHFLPSLHDYDGKMAKFIFCAR